MGSLHQLVVIRYRLRIYLEMEHLRSLVVLYSINPDLHGTQLLQIDSKCNGVLALASRRPSQEHGKGMSGGGHSSGFIGAGRLSELVLHPL
jgi:hypothetical protein